MWNREHLSTSCQWVEGWQDSSSSLERKCHFKIHSSSKMEKQMDLREIQEVKLQDLVTPWIWQKEGNGLLVCTSRAEWIVIVFPVLGTYREGLQLEEEECESDFANVESELLWRYSSDVSWADGHQDWSLRDRRDYKSGRYRYTNSVRNCQCGFKVLRNLNIYQTDRGHWASLVPAWGPRALGLKAVRMLNREAREGGKLQSEVSGITGNSTGRDLHYNSTTLEPQQNYA